MPKSLSVPRTSLHYNLEVSARRYPDKAAIVYYGSTLTYAALEREVDGAGRATCSSAAACERGDRVLLYAQNSPQFIIGYYAILRADGVVVPVNPMNQSGELRALHRATPTRASRSRRRSCTREIEPHLAKGGIEHCVLAAYSDYLREATDLQGAGFRARAARRSRAAPEVALWTRCARRGLRCRGATEAGPDDLAVLPYTSGTTGLPKGCMLTHSNLLATSIGGCAWAPTSSEAVLLGVLPMFHVTGMQANMNIPIQLGATTVLMTRWDRRYRRPN